MKTYEALVIFPVQGIAELQQGGKNPFEEAVTKNSGKIVNKTELGRRSLGYRVKKSSEGHFVSFVFELLPANLDALKRLLQLAEGILKFTIIAKPKVEFTSRAKPVTVNTAQFGERK